MITLLTTVLLVAGSALQSFGDAEQHEHISATDEAFGGILPEARELRSLDMDAAMKKYTRVGSSPYMRSVFVEIVDVAGHAKSRSVPCRFPFLTGRKSARQRGQKGPCSVPCQHGTESETFGKSTPFRAVLEKNGRFFVVPFVVPCLRKSSRGSVHQVQLTEL